MAEVSYYVAHGHLSYTLGVVGADRVYVMAIYPSGDCGGVSTLESVGWSLARWEGQSGAKEISESEFVGLLDG